MPKTDDVLSTINEEKTDDSKQNTLNKVLDILKSINQKNVPMTQADFAATLQGSDIREYSPGCFDNKPSLHDGQLKLEIDEVLAISLALLYEKQSMDDYNETTTSNPIDKSSILKNTVILYVGAAGGGNSHLAKMARYFPNIKFHLYDPKLMEVDDLNKINANEFKTNVISQTNSETEEQFTFHQQFFRDKDVTIWKQWKAKNPRSILILINDIRSAFDWNLYYRRRDILLELWKHRKHLSEDHRAYYWSTVFDFMHQHRVHNQHIEQVIFEDTFLPQTWAATIEVDYLLSKIREPWPDFEESRGFTRVGKTTQIHDELSNLVYGSPNFPYKCLTGAHFLQAWSLNSSSEQRLFVAKNQKKSRWNGHDDKNNDLEPLNLPHDYNDVEIWPIWSKPIQDVSDALQKTKLMQEFYNWIGPDFSSEDLDFKKCQDQMFQYNLSRSDQNRDENIQMVAQNTLNKFHEDYGIKGDQKDFIIRQPKCKNSKKSHLSKKQKYKHVDKMSVVMTKFENLYNKMVNGDVSKDDFEEKWMKSDQMTFEFFDLKYLKPENVNQKFESEISQCIKAMQDHIFHQVTSHKFYDNSKYNLGYKEVCKAPIFYFEEQSKWKLQILCILGLNAKWTKQEIAQHFFDEKNIVTKNEKHNWFYAHTIAHLRYNYIDFGRTNQLTTLENKMNQALDSILQKFTISSCFLPGCVTQYHACPPNFFHNRYWAICLYRQFMTYLQHNVLFSAQELEHMIDKYLHKDSNGKKCIAFESKISDKLSTEKHRYLETWPWRNPFLHAAAKNGNYNAVKSISELSNPCDLNYQRHKDKNSPINLVWYEIKEIVLDYKSDIVPENVQEKMHNLIKTNATLQNEFKNHGVWLRFDLENSYVLKYPDNVLKYPDKLQNTFTRFFEYVGVQSNHESAASHILFLQYILSDYTFHMIASDQPKKEKTFVHHNIEANTPIAKARNKADKFFMVMQDFFHLRNLKEMAFHDALLTYENCCQYANTVLEQIITLMQNRIPFAEAENFDDYKDRVQAYNKHTEHQIQKKTRSNNPFHSEHQKQNNENHPNSKSNEDKAVRIDEKQNKTHWNSRFKNPYIIELR